MTIVSHFFWNWYVARKRPWVWRFAIAGIAPDLPYLVLLAYYSRRFHVNGFTDLTVWDVVWHSPSVLAMHSFVPWGIAVGLASLLIRSRRNLWLPLAAGWLSHIIVDMLTHRSDGYPIFYPFSDYRFPTPVSYWEPAYHGRAFMLIDSTLMAVLLVHDGVTRRWRMARIRRHARASAGR